MEEWITLISNLGFPIVVSLILLVRIETRLENLTKAINELSQAIVSFKTTR
ncbi:MAG TPA: YvrJ family protein [Dictyoglomaceae bacterium]|nr:YvrJ family protein [Dictyoglomaceae bacterium]HOL39382.1 YvrJ family protein [Dictyoglomaceae bacterium]HOP95081.1 YvrJ family protein [Dictyoglomaceae bacterium]HPP16710.1 YvrJ family protein [Dictyoglomaceae bacterium]